MTTPFDLKVSDNGRYLERADGEPFFWLGDTAWELFHCTTKESADYFLKQRADNGYTVIQAVALSEFEGLTATNAYGRVPLLRNEDGEFDSALPDLSAGADGYSYWDHVDYVIAKAAEFGLHVALLPTWGDKFNKAWGKGPEIFDARSAYEYGSWIGDRYKDSPNVIWVLGGDRPLTKRRHYEVVYRMAQGIEESDGGRHLMTYHPCGEQSASHHMFEEKWLDFSMIQSSHSDKVVDNWKLIAADYALTPAKPTFEAEPCYEDHPRGFHGQGARGYFDDADVRVAAYYGLFSGGFGHTYGHHCVWGFKEERTPYYIMDWKTGIERPGSLQMKHVRALMESRPMLERVPDQSLLAENYEGANYMVATRGEAYAFAYSPNGLPFKLASGKLQGDVLKASWFDPRTGAFNEAGTYPNVEGTLEFFPPTTGRGSDWVLVLDGA